MEYPTNFNYVYEAISDLDQIPSTSAHNELVPTNFEALNPQNAQVNAITENPEPVQSKQVPEQSKQVPAQLAEVPARSEHAPAQSQRAAAQSEIPSVQSEQAITSNKCDKPQVIAGFQMEFEYE